MKTDNNQYLIIDFDSNEEIELNLTIYGTLNNYGICIVEFEEIEKPEREHNFKMYNFKKKKKH